MKYLAHCEQELIGPVSADKSSFWIYDSNLLIYYSAWLEALWTEGTKIRPRIAAHSKRRA